MVRLDLSDGCNTQEYQSQQQHWNLKVLGKWLCYSWCQENRKIATLGNTSIFAPSGRAEANWSGQQKIAAENGQKGNEKTEDHYTSNPGREYLVLQQDTGDREVETKIGLTISYLTQATLSRRLSCNQTIKHICDDTEKKDRECEQ
jgi:hypothetical protein